MQSILRSICGASFPELKASGFANPGLSGRECEARNHRNDYAKIGRNLKQFFRFWRPGTIGEIPNRRGAPGGRDDECRGNAVEAKPATRDCERLDRPGHRAGMAALYRTGFLSKPSGRALGGQFAQILIMDARKSMERRAGAVLARDLRVTAGLFRFSGAQFLGALILLLLSYPFVVDLEHGDLIETVLMMVLLISALLAVGEGSWVLAILLVAPALAGPWVDHYRPGLVPYWVVSGARMLFVGFVVTQLLRFILRSARVNSEVLCAGISAYLMLGLLWTSAYLTVSLLNPAAFSGPHLPAGQTLGRFDALYFSYVSLTCLGCNDISPVSKVARMMVLVESTTGVLYLAVLIARLVSLYSKTNDVSA
jgi:hypothetical protein